MNYEQTELNLGDDLGRPNSEPKLEALQESQADTAPQELRWASKDDGLDFGSPWEELHGREMPKYSDSLEKKKSEHSLSQEDIESSNRIADHEAEIQEAEKNANRPFTQEERDRFFENLMKKLNE